jgi:MFS family permease
MLMPVALLNYLDRQMLASMKFSVMGDIPSIKTEENWGYMLGQFKWVYAACSILGGYVADRFSRRFVIAGSLFVWSIVTFITGSATTYNQLLWTRSLMGISEAFYFPAALALIADYHVSHTRSRAVGLHQMAIYCGVICGGYTGFMADIPSVGWRVTFEFCGVIGIVYAIPLAIFLRNAPNSNVETGATKVFIGQSYLELLTNPAFILLVLYFTLPNLAGWVVRDWMPAILKQEYNVSQGTAGIAAAVYQQVASILGAIVGGWLADRWMQKNQRGRIYVSAIGMCMLIPAIIGMGNSPTIYVAVGFLILFGLGWGFFDINNMPILSQIVRPHLRATGYGVMNFVSISCGGLADWSFGKLRDQNVPLGTIFGLFAVAAVISVALVLLIRPRSTLATESGYSKHESRH